jgi:hypothetical protein
MSIVALNSGKGQADTHGCGAQAGSGGHLHPRRAVCPANGVVILAGLCARPAKSPQVSARGRPQRRVTPVCACRARHGVGFAQVQACNSNNRDD